MGKDLEHDLVTEEGESEERPRILEVFWCADCSRLRILKAEEDHAVYMCNHEEGLRFVADDLQLPDWCPLPKKEK